MKILFLSTGLIKTDIYPIPNQGGPVQIWGITTELAKRGHDISLLKAGNNNKKENVMNVNLLHVKNEGIDDFFAGIPSQFLFSKNSMKFIKLERPDVLYLHFPLSSYLPSFLDVPKIFKIGEPNLLDSIKPYLYHHHFLNIPLLLFKKKIEKKIMSNSDALVIPNKFMTKYIKTIGFSKSIFIPNGINPENFHNKSDDNFILYAGRFDWNKRVDFLIKAFYMVRREKDFKLKIVGDGYQKNYLLNLVKSLNLEDRVIFLPWLKRMELCNVMSKCSVFVLPSLFETSGIVVLEAMALNKPVIASNIPGPQDIITHNVDGFLFNPRRIKELEQYLELLIGDKELRKKIGQKARKKVERNFTFSKIADKYIKLFENILDKKSKDKL